MTKILYYNYFIKKGNTKTNASLIPPIRTYKFFST